MSDNTELPHIDLEAAPPEIHILKRRADGLDLEFQGRVRTVPVRGLKPEDLYSVAPLPSWVDHMKAVYGPGVEIAAWNVTEYARSWIISEAGSGSGVSFIAAADLPFQAVSWTVKDLVPSHSFGLLAAPPESWKSFLALEIAFSIVNGAPVLGKFPTMKGRVLYLAGEGVQGLRKRLEALKMFKGGSLDGLDVKTDWVSLMDNAREIAAEMNRRGKYELVIIDTLNRYLEGEENSAADVSRFIRALTAIQEETGAGILVLHHPAKADNSGIRGSSAILGALDYAFGIKRAGDSAEIRSVKSKEGPAFRSFHVRLKEQSTGHEDPSNPGTTFGSGVLVLADSPVLLPEPTPGTKAAMLLERLRKIWNGVPIDTGPKSALWDGLEWDGCAFSSKDGKHHRDEAKKGLIKTGHIEDLPGQGIRLLTPKTAPEDRAEPEPEPEPAPETPSGPARKADLGGWDVGKVNRALNACRSEKTYEDFLNACMSDGLTEWEVGRLLEDTNVFKWDRNRATVKGLIDQVAPKGR